MPVHTAPAHEGVQALDNLVARLEHDKEPIVEVLHVEGQYIVITSPRPARAAGRTEKRPAVKKAETR